MVTMRTLALSDEAAVAIGLASDIQRPSTLRANEADAAGEPVVRPWEKTCPGHKHHPHGCNGESHSDGRMIRKPRHDQDRRREDSQKEPEHPQVAVTDAGTLLRREFIWQCIPSRELGHSAA